MSSWPVQGRTVPFPFFMFLYCILFAWPTHTYYTQHLLLYQTPYSDQQSLCFYLPCLGFPPLNQYHYHWPAADVFRSILFPPVYFDLLNGIFYDKAALCFKPILNKDSDKCLHVRTFEQVSLKHSLINQSSSTGIPVSMRIVCIAFTINKSCTFLSQSIARVLLQCIPVFYSQVGLS